jgi:hypothetical protein
MKKFSFKFCGWLLAACAFLSSCGPTPAQQNTTQNSPPKGMRLFLLIGQSNMAGRGKIEPQDEVTNPRIWMLNKEQQWVLAKDPLHFDKPAVAGVGLASEFARTLANADPKITIGLIPCAVGGTSLDQWKTGGELYNNAVARAREAMKQGTLAGVLWHQGEADTNPDKVATYPVRFKTMMTQLRADLNAPDVPIVVGELCRSRSTRIPFNEMLPGLVNQIPRCALATSEDLVDKGDKVHFDSASLRTFGKRYAAAFLKIQTADKSFHSR